MLGMLIYVLLAWLFVGHTNRFERRLSWPKQMSRDLNILTLTLLIPSVVQSIPRLKIRCSLSLKYSIVKQIRVNLLYLGCMIYSSLFAERYNKKEFNMILIEQAACRDRI